jgi:hypothetical protein
VLIQVISDLSSSANSGYQHSVQPCWFKLSAICPALLIPVISILCSRVDSSYQRSVQPCWFKLSAFCSPSLSCFLPNNVTFALQSWSHVNMKHEVLACVNAKLMSSEAPFSLVERYQRFGGTCCLQILCPETLVFINQITRRHMPEDPNLNLLLSLEPRRFFRRR